MVGTVSHIGNLVVSQPPGSIRAKGWQANVRLSRMTREPGRFGHGDAEAAASEVGRCSAAVSESKRRAIPVLLQTLQTREIVTT